MKKERVQSVVKLAWGWPHNPDQCCC